MKTTKQNQTNEKKNNQSMNPYRDRRSKEKKTSSMKTRIGNAVPSNRGLVTGRNESLAKNKPKINNNKKKRTKK